MESTDFFIVCLLGGYDKGQVTRELPCHTRKVMSDNQNKETANVITAQMRSQVKILVVDDERDITSTLKRYFTFEGYDMDVINDPYSALKMIHEGNYMIVISDIAMPGMNGIELLSRIKNYNGMIQVIMITGYVTLDNILSCLRLGADDCFLKPLPDLSDLRKCVDEAIIKLDKWKRLMRDIAGGMHAQDGLS